METRKTDTKKRPGKMDLVSYRVAGQSDSTAEVVPLAIARAHAVRVEMESDPVERRIREAAERRRQLRLRDQQRLSKETLRRRQQTERAWRDVRYILDSLFLPLLNLVWIGALWFAIKQNWDQVCGMLLTVMMYLKSFV